MKLLVKRKNMDTGHTRVDSMCNYSLTEATIKYIKKSPGDWKCQIRVITGKGKNEMTADKEIGFRHKRVEGLDRTDAVMGLELDQVTISHVNVFCRVSVFLYRAGSALHILQGSHQRDKLAWHFPSHSLSIMHLPLSIADLPFYLFLCLLSFLSVSFSSVLHGLPGLRRYLSSSSVVFIAFSNLHKNKWWPLSYEYCL